MNRPGVPVTSSPGVRGVAPGQYRVVPTRSAVTFRIRKLGLFTVAGTFAVNAGRVEVGGNRALARIEIDAGSFGTASARRNADVRGPRFLDAAAHPVLSWTGELADGTSSATGTLRVRGTDSPLPVEVVAVEAGPSSTTVRARARVDRTAAGVAGAGGIAGRLLDVEVTLTLLPG